LFIKKSVKRNKFRKAMFITITALIAIGLVIPLAGLFQRQPDSGGSTSTSQQTTQDRLAELEAKALENPSDTAILMDLAETYVYTGNPDLAVKTYEQVLALDPGQSEARYDIAFVYYMSGKYDQAEAKLQELIQKDPDNKDAHRLYGIVLGTGKKDYTAGIKEMEKYITLAKEGPDVEKARQIINEWKTQQPQN